MDGAQCLQNDDIETMHPSYSAIETKHHMWQKASQKYTCMYMDEVNSETQ